MDRAYSHAGDPVKGMSPALTILLAVHNKPTVADAIQSVLEQTRTDFACIVLDSGQWIGKTDLISDVIAQAHSDYSNHPLIEWIVTGEGPDLKREVCPIGWVTNEAIRAGLVRGRYMCTFYDDDLYRRDFVEKMVGYLDAHPDAGAVWCAEDRVTLYGDGSCVLTGHIPAGGPKSGATFDNLVDGAQVMWRTRLLDDIGDPWLPEDPNIGTCRHSDGIFLDKLGSVTTVWPVNETLVTHRFTPWSTYTPSG